MKAIRDFFADKNTARWSFYVIWTTIILYLTWILVSHLGVAVSAIGSGILSFLNALAPLWIGLVMAYLFNPFIEFLERTVAMKLVKPGEDVDSEKGRKHARRRKMAAVLIAYIIILLIIALIIYGFAALIIGQLVVKNVPQMFEHLSDMITGYMNSIKEWAANMPSATLSEHASDLVNSLFGWVANSFNTESVVATLNSITSTIVNIIIGLIISVYLSYDKEKFVGLWNSLLARTCSQKRKNTINGTLNEVDRVLSTFLRGVLLDALIIAILSSIGLSLIGMQFAVFIGIFAGICNIIPYFGPVLGMIPAFIVGLLTQDVWHGLLAVLVLFIIQQIDGNFIYPKVVGTNTGLHPLLVLLAVFIAGKFFGLAGMVLAVPVTAIIKLFVLKWYHRQDTKKDAKLAFAGMPDDGGPSGDAAEERKE
ncbi:MAG: AI-2E family transporter [Anaerovoracaceae bacterium]|jgi:predicted PurR-regulated permease PerM